MLSGDIWGDFYHEPWFERVKFIIGRGHLGIILFFVLSGFLITSLLLWEFKSKGRINTIKFFIRRFLRVWPLYFIMIGFSFFIFPKLPFGVETVHEFWRYSLFLSNFDEIINGPLDPINFMSTTWTIAVEEQFYIIWGIVVSLLTIRGRLNINLIYIIGIGVILTSLTFRYFHLSDNRILYYHSVSVMSDLAFGCIIGAWAFSGKGARFFEKLERWKIIIFYIVAFFLLLFEGHIFKGPLFVFERITPAIILSVLILEQVYSKSSFVKLDKIPFFSFSGEITYSFYVLHSVFIFYWVAFFEANNYTDHVGYFVAFFSLVFLSTYIGSYITYKAIEAPIFKLRKYFR